MQKPDAYWVGYLAEALALVLEADDVEQARGRASAALCELLLRNDRLWLTTRHAWVKAIINEEMRNGARSGRC